MNWQLTLYVLLALAITGVFTSVMAFYAWRRRGINAAISSIGDPAFVLDRQNRVVDLNRVAQDTVGGSPAVGRPVHELLGVEASLLAVTDKGSETALPITLELSPDLAAAGSGRQSGVVAEEPRIFEARFSAPLNRDMRGQHRLLILRDISRARQAEVNLLAQKELYENLVAIAQATAERPTLEATLQNALDVTATITGAEYGSLFLLDNAGLVTHSIVALGRTPPGQLSRDRQTEMARRVLDKGLAGWVARHHQLALIYDTMQDKRWLPPADNKYNARSALAVPILSGANLLGVLTLTHSQPQQFDDAQGVLMQAAADQMALALRNAQIYDEERRLADRQLTLYEVLRAAGGHLDSDAVAHAAVRAIARFTPWPHVALLLPDDDGNLVVQASAGAMATAEGWTVPIGQGVTGRAARLGRMQHVTDTSADPDYIRVHPDILSEVAVPLQRGERILGVLDVGSDRLAGFGTDDVRLAVSVAEAIVLALDNARSHTAMRQHAADLNALYIINRMIGRSIVLEDMLSKSLSSVLVSLGFEAGMIGLADPDNSGLALAAQRGMPPAMMERIVHDGLDGSFCSYVHQQREAMVLGDIQQPGSQTRRLATAIPQAMEELAALEIRACSGVPLLHQQRSLGALCLFSRQPRSFSADNEALQVTIGQQIANAVANAQLFETIADERSLLQSIIESSRDGIVLIGPQRRVRVINEPALRFLRLPGRPEEWVGRSLGEALHAMRRHARALLPDALAEIRKVRQGTEPASEGESELAPRVLRWIHVPVITGRVLLGRLLVLRDVTEQRSVERMREDLTYTMVHDLRSPLTGILGSVEFVDRSLAAMLTPEQRQVLDIARGNTQRMLRLVNAILDISRLESGRMPLENSPFALPEFIAEALQAHLPLAVQKGLRVESSLPPGLPLAWADKGLFERVMQNLVGNAIKFTPAGGLVCVTARADASDRPRIFVSVNDNGPGIPLELQERVFDKFATGRHEESGSGLGLAFCKMVVEAHGQRIWAESEPGQGATFTFTLPSLPAAGL